MIKLKGSRIIAVLLVMISLFTVMPVTSFAAQTLTLDAISDILPGGAEVGFKDVPSAGGSERGLETIANIGVCLRKGEWIKYDISSLTPGVYQFTMSTGSTSQAFVKVSVNDVVVSSKATVKVSGSYSLQKDTKIDNVVVTGGKSILTIENVSDGAMYVKSLSFVDANLIKQKEAFLAQSRPYKMSYLPCIIEAENFDSGKSGVAYYDSDEGNVGAMYRPDVDVDIYEQDGDTYVNMVTDDWMAYTISVNKTANYDLIFSMQDMMETSKIRAYLDGYEILRIVPENLMPLGEIRETVVGSFYIKEGVHTFYIKCLDGDVNLDYIRFRKSSEEGIDTSDLSKLRPWADSQELSDEDYTTEAEVVNPVERELYVDAAAKDGGDGSAEKPFNTIEKAQEYVRTITKNMKGDIVVNLKGEFFIDKTLKFTEKDSGNGIYNVIYRGDETAAISGGKKIDGWKKTSDARLWQTKVPNDIKDFRQIYVGNNRGIRAKSEWLYWMVAPYDDPEIDSTNAEGFYIDESDFPFAFSKPEDMEMAWLSSWRNVRAPIDSITPQGDGTLLVQYAQPHFDSMHNNSAPINIEIPYYLENAPEFLDRPGEYYFDKATRLLTYYPAEYEDMTKIDCYVPQTETLLQVVGENGNNKVRNITFEGIEFKYGAWNRTTERGFSTLQADQMLTRDETTDEIGVENFDGKRLVPAQVQVHFASNINFKENKFIHLGSAALSFNNMTVGCIAEGNLFDDISATAVTVGDWRITQSDPLDKYTRKIKIRNNLIRRPAVEYMTPIITGYYVNNIVVDHNDILDAPYTGISMGWGWGANMPHSAYNRMTNNRIENVTFRLMDGGHIYTLDPMKGGIISGNHCIKAGEWKGGIYHDNSSAYIKSTNNVFEECPKWYKITWHTVRDNVAYNNYSERPYVVTYPETNKVEKEKGKVNGEWPQEAKDIIANAGLQDDYAYLLDDYNKETNLRNYLLEDMKFHEGAGMIIPAGDIIDGGEGVAYHEVLSNADGRSMEGEPSIYEEYDGTGLLYIMVTAQGEWTKHKFTVDEAGEYDIFANLAVVNPSTAISVEIDGKELVNKLQLTPNCKVYDVFTDFNVGKTWLEPGEHEIKIEHAVANFGFKYIRIAKEGEVFNRNDGFNQNVINVALGK